MLIAYTFSHSSSKKTAFGMVMPERSFSSEKYRWGFNGKENDNETRWQDYGFRMYYPGLGKFLSVDPLTKSYPMLSPFQFASNTPIWAIDWDGLEARLSIYSKGKDVNAFLYRANKVSSNFAASKNAYSIHGISSGSELMQLLKDKTKEQGSIQNAVIFSHGYQHGLSIDYGHGQGLYMDNGSMRGSDHVMLGVS